jgi:hypothetical protein
MSGYEPLKFHHIAAAGVVRRCLPRKTQTRGNRGARRAGGTCIGNDPRVNQSTAHASLDR